MIPLIRPEFPNLRLVEKYFNDAFKNRQFSNFGEIYYKCARELSAFTGGHALPVTSGTAAIQIALALLGMRGKRVGLPDFTHSGTLLAVVNAGAQPVLLPVSEKSWTITPQQHYLDKEFGLDCIVAVAPFGYFLDVSGWEDFSRRTSMPIVYDLAGAWGHFPETQNPRCYSFHSTKNFGVGEGGCVVLSSEEDWGIAQRLSNFGTLPDRTIEDTDGFNFKPDELKCASILAGLQEDQLQRAWRRIQGKQALLRFYHENIRSHLPPGPKKPSLCVLGNLPAQEIEELGREQGITFRRYFPLLSKMPGLKHLERLGTSPDSMERCLALPSDVSWNEAYRVVDFVNGFLGGKK